MSIKGHTPSPFSSSFHAAKLSGLRYNISTAGAVVAMVYGTHRLSPNVLEFFDYHSSGGGGKGGKGIGGTTGKKGSNQTYSVDVAFGICQGPVSFAGASHGAGGSNRVWGNGGVTGFSTIPLNDYVGTDGQAADPVFLSSDTNIPVIGYSGLAYVTGTPLQLGSSPVLPNISVEITGFEAGTIGGDFPDDAKPSEVIEDLLTNLRYGAGFPSASLDTAGSLADWGVYCQAAGLAMSVLMDRQQPAARWLEEIAELSVSAVVWSGSRLKVIPYGDVALSAYGASWTPNLTWQYDLGDGDFLRQGEGEGAADPVLVERADPAQMTNWLSVEYLDSAHDYNPQVIPVFDQGLIDEFGLRSEAAIQAHHFTNSTSATNAAQLLLQRKAYIRNTFKFKLGWKFALLEPMDIVLLTDATLGLDGAAVRITAIEEDDNGELAVTAEEIPGVTP